MKNILNLINDISIISNDELEKITVEWNDTEHEIPENKTIQALFEQQVLISPNDVALFFERESLSYSELNNRSNQLAHFLRKQGVRRDGIVAFYLERSFETVISILAILKAGGAFLPLDQSNPIQRTMFMLKDSEASCLITDSRSREHLSDYHGKIIEIDQIHGELLSYPSINPKPVNLSVDLAYVIYTSGSTGVPKGAMIEHGSLVNRLAWQQSKFNLTSKDRVLQKTSNSFDVSVWENIWPLLNGAKLYILAREAHKDPIALVEYIIKHRITTLHFVPSMLKEFLRAECANQCDSLKTVICSGETLPVNIQKAFFETLQGNLYNLYGPTEASIDVSYYECQRDSSNLCSVPIGRPIWNTQLYILDNYLKPVPLGVEGELYIGGIGLARGYLNRQELTTEKFIDNPFKAHPDKLYRTGDRARFLNDGNIEYLGRVDSQVKIRGNRIECQEVEYHLQKHPKIEDAVVVCQDLEIQGSALVAYMITTEEVSSDDIRAFLSQFVPDYMLPSYFNRLEKFPTTINGKLDKNQLPKPRISERDLNQQVSAPKTMIEHQLVSVWKSVLNIESVGIDDNFFHLGGHSLLATHIVAKIRKYFNVDMSLREFFEAKTIANLAKVIISSVQSIQKIPKIEREKNIPLSFAQQRLWFMEQLIPGTSIYNLPVFVRLSGTLCKRSIVKAYTALIERHEALRTVIEIDHKKEPCQRIQESSSYQLEEISVDSIERTYQILQAEAEKPFKLNGGSLIRAKLLAISQNDNILLITMHHLISDAWSMQVFFTELSVYYKAFRLGISPHLSQLEIQYCDFSAWQRSWLVGSHVDQQLDYWKDYLDGCPHTSQFPVDRIRTNAMSSKGAIHTMSTPLALLNKIELLSKKYQTTLFPLLLTALQVLLYRYTGQDDIVIGAPINNRHYPQVEVLIGFFVNTLAIRTTFNEHMTFEEALLKNQKNILNCYENQDVPFEKIVEHLNIKRETFQNPLYQIRFVLENKEEQAIEFHGLTVAPLVIEHRHAKFDLLISARETASGLVFKFEYATDIFDHNTVENIAQNFDRLLNNLIAQAEEKVSRVSLLRADETQKVLQFSQGNTEVFNYPGCFNQQFQLQALKYPDKIAVIYRDLGITYQALNARVNQMARYLIECNIRHNQIVAICLERSAEMIVALLAIIRVGAAYLPIDIGNPKHRLALILEDAQPSLLITNEATQKKFDFYAGNLVIIESLNSNLSKYSSDEIKCHIQINDLIYVIYTSGSTGTPKGVKITHGNILNYIYAISRVVNFGDEARVATTSTLAADLGNTMIFTALGFGHTLSIIPEEALLNPSLFSQYLEAHQINCIKITPTHFKSLLEVEKKKNYLHQIDIIFGGEKLDKSFVYQLPNARIFNHYGPTETTIGAAVYQVNKKQTSTISILSVPIGRPLFNVQIYIVDSYLKPVPVGVKGEIVIGGKGVAQGYLNNDILTREKFLPNPFSQNKSDCIYRTGDQGRYLLDGTIEFVGRIDEQVKIRGHRVECGEIQAILKQHGDVNDTIVHFNQALVAYIIPGTFTPTTLELRKYLEDRLPSYMIPSYFVFVESFPTTANGKLDIKALPKPNINIESGELKVGELETEQEKKLAEIWKKLLKISVVGRTDDFFQLGGHSLLAIKLIADIRNEFHLEISLRDLFQYSTIERLAAHIEGKQDIITQIPVADRVGRLALSYAQQRLWFLDQIITTKAVYNIPVALRLTGALDTTALKEAYLKLILRHEILRTSIKEFDNQPYQYIYPQARENLRGIKVSRSEISQYLEKEALFTFDLEHDPLIRGLLLEISDNEHLLIVTMHHIVSDGWSMQIFFRELCHFYNMSLDNSIKQLPDLSIQYSDFAAWQRSWLDLVVDKQLSFWKDYLKNSPETSQFPTDKIRPKEKSYIGSAYNIKISNESLISLQRLAKKYNATLFMSLITALQALFYRYTAQDDVVIGAPVSNRHYRQVENLIGFFVNTLPLRFTFDDQISFTQALLKNKESILNCYENQDVPFEQVVDELQIYRDLSQHPIYQIRFVLDNHDENPVSLHGISSEFLILERETAKFDLMISAQVTSTGLDVRFEYATDLFEHSTIQHIATCFEVLLNNMISEPNIAISQLPLMSTKQAQAIQILNQTSCTPIPLGCFNKKFYSQVKQFPNHIAVTFGKQTLSYQELNARVNQMVNYLLEQQVTANHIVAICLERSLESIVCMLAIIRVGAAYLPIDSGNPKPRLKHILEDAQPSLLIYHETLTQSFDFYKGQKLTIESIIEQSKQYSRDTKAIKTKENDLLYIIYTSGSTGSPKGVKITHRNVLNYIQAILDVIGFNRYSHVATTSTLAADLGNTMIFTALAYGKTLSIVPEEVLLNGTLFSQFLQEQKVDCIKITPTHFKTLLESENKKSYLHQVEIIFGGEKLEWSLVDHLLNPRIFNHYGPTEATIGAAVYDVKQNQNNRSLGLTVPIGKPLTNVKIYLLDNCLQLVPIGVRGEIFIGGQGVAQGYLNQEELTQEKFIVNPFIQARSERLYRTGDYGRYLSDGNLEFLGRKDEQVKIRGYRVECGEIQSVLKQHGDVKDAIVVVQNQKLPEHLSAYIIPGEFTPSIEELRSYLESRLPTYMIPTYFVLVDAFPMMANGKLNLKALPNPDERNLQLSEQRVLPSTKIESELANIWKTLLNLSEISIYDNFFQIGGDSIISIQFVSKARKIGYSFNPKEIFLHPTINELGKIIEQRIEQEVLNDVMSPESVDTYYYPLSPMQKGMLFHSLYQSHSQSYVVSNLFTLNEGIDETRLKNAWFKVINQFDILRTSFVWEDSEQPMQRVARDIRLPWYVCNWTMHSEAIQMDLLKQLVENERNKGLDLSHAPVYRFYYIILGQNKCYLLWIRHHILCDGWSSAIILSQVANEYFNPSAGKSDDIKDWTRYYQYIRWLEQQDNAKTKIFWKRYLKDLSGDSRLSSNVLNTTNNVEEDYGYLISHLSESETNCLVALAKVHKTTMNTVAQVAWSIVLHKVLQQSDFVFGFVVSGRSIVLDGVENIVGNLINTLPLRVSLSESETVRSLILKLQSDMVEIQEFSTCSLAQIQATCGQKEKTVLFDNIVVFENFPMNRSIFSNDSQKGLFSDAKTFEKSEYFLTLTVIPGQQLHFKFGYEKNDINNQIVQMLSDALCYVFKQILKNPERAITELSILPNEQCKVLLKHWNNTDFPFADSQVPVHRLFERQVAKTPQLVAVMTDGKSYTYEELNREINRVSNYLIKENNFKNQVIAIYLERSVESIISILASLKIGAHYVYIDIKDPVIRVQSILEDTRASIVLTNDLHSANLPQGFARIINLNAIRVGLDNTCITNPPSCDNITSPAYIIYTSGSTGKPKGVVVIHQSLTNYLCWAKDEYLDDEIRSIPLHSSLAFDMSITSLFVPLISGNNIQVIQDRQGVDVLHHIVKQMEHSHFIKLTPTHLRLLKDYLAEQKNYLCQTKFIIGGERLQSDIVAELQALLPNATFYNEYGPTEATVACSIFKIPKLSGTEKCISIGRPIWNTRIFILDKQMNPVPIGVTGQIYIGGVGLAVGYLNQPGLTDNKFNNHIHDSNDSKKLYQTGDLGRYYPDGNIEYIGRIDGQVKIKGYRIECGEIEYYLKKHGDVKDAIVLVHKNNKNNQSLVAYIIANEFVPNSLELSSFLTKYLPEYMIPKFYEIMEKYPTTINGKLDISLLPAPDTPIKAKSSDDEAPKSELEIEILDLWKSVLGLNNIGVTENFFQLGGDSILCIQLMTLARKSGILFDIKDIFENPTIQALAKSTKGQTKISSKENTNTRNISQESFSLAPIQEWFFERQLVNQNYFNQSFLLDINERLSTSPLNQGVVSLLNQHETLRIRFRKSDGKWTQYYANNPADQEWIDRIDLADDSFEKQNSEMLKISQAKQAQLNIEKGPLFNFTLFELGQRKQKLLIIIHHLLIDGISWRILLEDLEAICKTKHDGEKDLILERTDLYMDWIESLRAYANSSKLKAEYPFWQQMVNQEIKALLIDHNLGIASVDNTLSISGQLSVEKTHALLKDIPSVYNTKINDILLAALALTITQCLGNDNIYISLEGHGRELVDKEIDTSRTLGWFTSIFPVLIHLDSKFDIGLSIQNTKKALQCIPENGVGYSIIKYLSEHGAEFKHAKQPEISFNYLGQWDNNVNKTSLFNFAMEEHGNSNAIENRNLYLLNINSLVKNGQFQIAWKYSTNHFSSITIQGLVDNYIKNLEGIISHCLRRQVKYMMPLNHIGSLNPFFCIHPIDGDIHWLHEFATKLDSNRPFIAIENISLSYDLFDSIKKIETLAKLYIAEIKRVQPKGPYYIGGWSFGAVVAFEIAKLLESEGEEIENLILFDQYPVDPEVSGDIIKKIEADKDTNFRKAYQNSKKNFNDYIQNNLMGFDGVGNPRYKHISSDSYQYMKANTSAYFLNRNLLKGHRTIGKVKRITSILSKKTYAEKSQIAVNPWKPFCDHYRQYVIDGDHNSIFQEPFINQLLDILLEEEYINHD